MIRVTIPISESSRYILAHYKKARGIKLTDDVVEAFVQEYGKDLAPSTIPRIKKEETATIVVGYTSGRPISAAATVNDRFWY